MARFVLVVGLVVLLSSTVGGCGKPTASAVDKETVIGLLRDASRCPRQVTTLMRDLGARAPRAGEPWPVLGLLYFDLAMHGHEDAAPVRRADPTGTGKAFPSDLLSRCLAEGDPADESPPALLPEGLRDLQIHPNVDKSFTGAAEYLIGGAWIAQISFAGGWADGTWALDRVWLTGRPYGVGREGSKWGIYYEGP